MTYRVLAALAVVVCFAVFFQNCGMNVRFANMDGKLLAKNVSDDDGDNGGQGDPDESPTPEPSASPTATPGESPSPSASPTATPLEGDGGPLTFVCVLEGPGRSVLLGYLEEELVASGNTPDTICTTKRGCEDIVSLKFDVKEAWEREYCSHNKHVRQADEATLRLLIGE